MIKKSLVMLLICMGVGVLYLGAARYANTPKTYRNDDLGVSFTYPRSLSVFKEEIGLECAFRLSEIWLNAEQCIELRFNDEDQAIWSVTIGLFTNESPISRQDNIADDFFTDYLSKFDESQIVLLENSQRCEPDVGACEVQISTQIVNIEDQANFVGFGAQVGIQIMESNDYSLALVAITGWPSQNESISTFIRTVTEDSAIVR